MSEFKKFIDSERSRLGAELDRLGKQKATLDDQIAKLEQELAAIEAYEAVKEGKAPAPRRKGGGRRGVKDEMMRVVRGHQAGISRADLLEKMGVKGDRAAEQSVSNALASAKKRGELTASNGIYRALPSS